MRQIKMDNADQFARIVEGTVVPEKRIGFFDVVFGGSGSFYGDIVESTKRSILSILTKEFKA